MPWYRGNTHTHTLNSDGNDLPDVVARRYRELGYQFLFITDHDYVTDVAPLNALLGCDERFVVFPGQEITQWIGDFEAHGLHSAHVNSLFAREVVTPVGDPGAWPGSVSRGAFAEFGTPVADTFRANIDGVLAQGGIAQVNHPNCLWTVAPEDLDEIPDGTLLEVWNAVGICNNLGGLSPRGELRPSVEGFWDRALSRGKVVWGTAVDDSHEDAHRGRAWIVVRAPELSDASIARALRAGDFYASTGVVPDKKGVNYGVWIDDIETDDDAHRIRIRSVDVAPGIVPGPSFLTRFIGQDGVVLAEEHGPSPEYRFRGDETYVRASIIDSEGNRAWTQPVFRDGRLA